MARRARLLVAALVVTGSLRAEESVPVSDVSDAYTARRWTLDDGLPDSTVCGVAAGTGGFLWLATEHALVRFDGLRFEPVALPEQAALGEAQGLFQDYGGGVWIYGFFGAARYAEGGWWASEAGGMPRGRVYAVAEGTNGVLYLAQGKTLYAWQNGHAHPILRLDAFPDESGPFRQLAWSGDGELWMVVGDGLYRWCPDDSKPPVRMTETRAEWVLAVGADRSLIAHGSFVCLKWIDGGWRRLPETRLVSARCLLDWPGGGLWVGHDSGADVFLDGVWHTDLQNLLQGTAQTRALAVDRERNLWLATSDGLIRLRRRVFQSVSLMDAPASSEVSALWVEPGGGVWAGLRLGGVAVGDARGVAVVPASDGFPSVPVTALYRSADGALWCGGAEGSLWVLKDRVVRSVKGLSAEEVRGLLGTGGPPLWVATRRGLFGFDAAAEQVADIGWPQDAVSALGLDRDHTLWVGHERLGLAALRSGDRDEFFQGTGLPGRTIRALCRDSEGVLWIGGLDGLARWENNRRFVFGRAQGLWNVSILQIAEDGSGFLWLGTADGVMRIAKRDLADVALGRKERLTVRVFGAEAGLTDTRCTGRVAFPVGDPPRDRLWFLTRAGVMTTDTRELPPPKPVPDVRLTAWEAGRLVVAAASVRSDDRNGLAERSAAHDVRVAYTALDFSAPERVRFDYTLDGPVRVRSGLTETREALFSRLPPGTYTFRVAACNSDGVWSASVPLAAWTVRPFFWETLGFRVACLLLVLGVVGQAVRRVERRRTRRRLERVRREQEIARERARIARDLHDEIGAKLTRLSLLGAMAAEDAKGAEPLCGEIAKMTDTALEAHRVFDEIVWSLSPRNDTVRGLARYICSYAETFFAETPIRCSFAPFDDRADRPIQPQRRHQIFLAVKEALNNVLKHAEATRVNIVMTWAEGWFRVEIADDGRGFDPAVVARGNGLQNMRERMAGVGGRLTLTSAPGEGTRLVFEMPV